MKAWQLLDSPEKWTQGGLAYDKDGRSVNERSQDAVCWCMLGACYRVYPPSLDRHKMLAELSGKLGHYVVDWNDAPERTHQEVLAVLKELDI